MTRVGEELKQKLKALNAELKVLDDPIMVGSAAGLGLGLRGGRLEGRMRGVGVQLVRGEGLGRLRLLVICIRDID